MFRLPSPEYYFPAEFVEYFFFFLGKFCDPHEYFLPRILGPSEAYERDIRGTEAIQMS